MPQTPLAHAHCARVMQMPRPLGPINLIPDHSKVCGYGSDKEVVCPWRTIPTHPWPAYIQQTGFVAIVQAFASLNYSRPTTTTCSFDVMQIKPWTSDNVCDVRVAWYPGLPSVYALQ